MATSRASGVAVASISSSVNATCVLAHNPFMRHMPVGRFIDAARSIPSTIMGFMQFTFVSCKNITFSGFFCILEIVPDAPESKICGGLRLLTEWRISGKLFMQLPSGPGSEIFTPAIRTF